MIRYSYKHISPGLKGTPETSTQLYHATCKNIMKQTKGRLDASFSFKICFGRKEMTCFLNRFGR